MPQILLGAQSGGINILSGNYWSGQGTNHPVGGVQLMAHPNNSGIIYVALSGPIGLNSGGVSVTQNSGVFQQSGSIASGLGNMDGMPLTAGTPYFIPRLAFPQSSSGVILPQIWVTPDANCSGQARVNWEIY